VKDKSGNEATGRVTFTLERSSNNFADPRVGFNDAEHAPLTVAPDVPITVRGWAADDQQVSEVRWTLSGATSGSGTLPGGNTWALTLPRLSLGYHTLTVVARDGTKTSVAASLTIRAQNNPDPGPGPQPGNETSGDIRKDTKKCGVGGGIASALLLFGSLMALGRRRRIE
jgi:hypothetical protein